MKKRFVVMLDLSTPEQETALKDFFAAQSAIWWHWLTNAWLVSDSKGLLTAGQIRDALNKIAPGVSVLVLELRSDSDTWSGFGPSSEKRNMFQWIKDHWNK